MRSTSITNVNNQEVYIRFDEETMEIKESRLAKEPYTDYTLNEIELEMAEGAIRRLFRKY